MGLTETSIFISSIDKLWDWYRFFNQWLNKIYKDSRTHRLTGGLCNKLKLYFRYSFINRITEDWQINNEFIDNSRVKRVLKKYYEKYKGKIVSYFMTSKLLKLGKEIKKEVCSLTLRRISVIIIIAVLTNLLFSIILLREISLRCYLKWSILLTIGIIGLFCEANLESIRESSFFLKWPKR